MKIIGTGLAVEWMLFRDMVHITFVIPWKIQPWLNSASKYKQKQWDHTNGANTPGNNMIITSFYDM